MHNLGALSLDSQPLRHSLRAEAAAWKAHFTRNIHAKAAADLAVRVLCWLQLAWRWLAGDGGRLGGGMGQGTHGSSQPATPTHPHTPPSLPTRPLSQAFVQYLRELTARLGRRIEDLDDVKAVVAALREVRRRCWVGRPLAFVRRSTAAGHGGSGKLPRCCCSSPATPAHIVHQPPPPPRALALYLPPGARARGQRGRGGGPH